MSAPSHYRNHASVCYMIHLSNEVMVTENRADIDRIEAKYMLFKYIDPKSKYVTP